MRPGPLRESLPEHSLAPGGGECSDGPSLLVVDGDEEMLRTLGCYFRSRGFRVAMCRSLADTKTFFHRQKTWSLVLADYHLPDGNGRELHAWVRTHTPFTPVLLMSGSAHADMLCGDVDYLAKPFRIDALEALVVDLAGRR